MRKRLGYGPEDRRIAVRFQASARDFSLCLSVQTGTGAQWASYSMSKGALPPVVKWSGVEADHPPSSSTKIINVWSYTSTTPYALMASIATLPLMQ
jgi:hypothetical protein